MNVTLSKLYSEKSMFRTVTKFVHNTEEVRRVWMAHIKIQRGSPLVTYLCQNY